MTDDDERVQVNAYTRRRPKARSKVIESIAPKEGAKITDTNTKIIGAADTKGKGVTIVTQHPAK